MCGRRAEKKSARVPFRLPIDRVFSVDGFGTVVTGTLIEGALHVGSEAELLPSGTRSRVRNLQVHGENTAIAIAGQRVAVNLAGIKRLTLSAAIRWLSRTGPRLAPARRAPFLPAGFGAHR